MLSMTSSGCKGDREFSATRHEKDFKFRMLWKMVQRVMDIW